jgi:hypothetical protein
LLDKARSALSISIFLCRRGFSYAEESDIFNATYRAKELWTWRM